MKYTAWESLCVHYCLTYGVDGKHLFEADKQSAAGCSRRRGPGRPPRKYPTTLIAATLPFLLLASQRLTELPIDWIAGCLKLDEWDALEALADAEKRLNTDQLFADAFQEFFDSYRGDERAQAHTVKKFVAMTYEEIGAKIGLSWQRVQQIEKEALEKLRADPVALAMLMEAM